MELRDALGRTIGGTTCLPKFAFVAIGSLKASTSDPTRRLTSSSRTTRQEG